MADTVENDLGDGALAVVILAAGLVIDGAGKAGEGLGAGCRIALEREWLRRRVGAAVERDLGIDLECLVRSELPDQHWRRRGRGRRYHGAAGKLRRRLSDSADRDGRRKRQQPEADRLARVKAQERRQAGFQPREGLRKSR